jgi:tape measure domain-containing protein
MAAGQMRYELRINADGRVAVREIRRVEEAGDGLGRSTRALGAEASRTGRRTRELGREQERLTASQRAAASAQQGLAAGYRNLRAAALGYLSLRGAAQALLSADDYRVLQGRVQRLGGDFERLYEIAQGTNLSTGSVVSLFQRLGLTRETLGATTSQVEAVTQAVLQLGRIGSSSQQEIESAAAQLGQAFGSAEAQWEEFAIIADSMPELLRRIERGLGIMPGTIKQSVSEGDAIKPVRCAVQFVAQLAHGAGLLPDLAREGLAGAGDGHVVGSLGPPRRAALSSRRCRRPLSRVSAHVLVGKACSASAAAARA